jgi:hypothetical protein
MPNLHPPSATSIFLQLAKWEKKKTYSEQFKTFCRGRIKQVYLHCPTLHQRIIGMSSTIMNFTADTFTVEQLSSRKPSKSLDDHSSATSVTEMENSTSQSEELGSSLDLGSDARHCRGLADSSDWDDSFAGEDSFAVHEGNGPYRAVAFRELVTVGEHGEDEEDDNEESNGDDMSCSSDSERKRK